MPAWIYNQSISCAAYLFNSEIVLVQRSPYQAVNGRVPLLIYIPSNARHGTRGLQTIWGGEKVLLDAGADVSGSLGFKAAMSSNKCEG